MFKQWLLAKYRKAVARYRFLLSHGKELNRRVTIENTLLAMATGKQPLPDKEACRILGLKLGTPVELWPETWKTKP